MNSKITVLHARKWELEDEVTKQQRSGVSIRYVMTDNLTPNVDADTGELGYSVMKESISVEAAKVLVDVPGVYDAEFILRSKADKNVLVVSSLTFCGKGK